MAFDLIIFDCDGTLVDSETLYNTITSELLTELGLPQYTPQRCVEEFTGYSWGVIKAKLEDTYGNVIPPDIIQRYINLANTRMDDVKAVDGAVQVIEAVQATHKICVASNGERNNVLKSLRVTRLLDYFPEGDVFTKIQVERPKPAPDLFLFTAAQMGVDPADCLVIEDSVVGVKAAKAAGMQAIGFVGGPHDAQTQGAVLKNAGADIIVEEFIHILDHV